MTRVNRLLARVMLDDPRPAVERAEAEAAAGDESWGQWVAEYRRGEAIIVRLCVTLEVSGADGSNTVEATNQGVFLQTDSQAPKIEQQVAELVGKDFTVLEQELAARGHHVDASDLHDMYVHVELGEDVLRSLVDAGSNDELPRSDARVSRDEVSSSGSGVTPDLGGSG